ncbi:MAG: hypothetical protein MK105_02210 [Crocinitomicaceae bacterium]|nr:hypothetical protein [Crocinitomicaceae bacterium]
MKVFLATFIGLVICFMATPLLELVGHNLFPVPFKVDFSNMEEFNANKHLIPTGAYISVALSRGISLVLGLMTARLIEKADLIPLYIIAGFILFGTIANAFGLPHPTWFKILEISLVTLVSASMLYFYFKKSPKATTK